MRVVIGYTNGRAIWSDHGPGYGGSSKIGGSLVVSVSGPDEKARKLADAARHRAKKRAERAKA